MKKIITSVLMSAFLFIPFSAEAKILEVFKCQGTAIEVGDTTYAVLKKCGEPAFKEEVSAEGCEKVEKWHYDCKRRGYVDLLLFKAGVLVDRFEGEKSEGVQDCK